MAASHCTGLVMYRLWLHVSSRFRIPRFLSTRSLLYFKWKFTPRPPQNQQSPARIADMAEAGDSDSNSNFNSNSGTQPLPLSQPPTTKSKTTATTTTASIASALEGSVSPAAGVAVTFRSTTSTLLGQTVKITGSIPELGSWDTSKALALSAAQYTPSQPMWVTTLDLPVGTSFEYKFVRVDGDGALAYQPGENRSYTVPQGSDGTATVHTSWE